MTRAVQGGSLTLTRAALAGLGIGAAVTSFLGTGILAGFLAVAIAAGVFLALRGLAGSGRVVSSVSAACAMLFPMAVAARGEDGILIAAAASFVVISLAYVLSGRVPGSLQALAVAAATVLHLGLLGSYLLLVAGEGNRLLPALVLMAAAFEAAFLTVSGRGRPPTRRQTLPAVSELVNVRAAIAGVVACQAAALLTRLFLPARLGLLSLLVLGTVVAGSALLGHASASAVRSQGGVRDRVLGTVDPAVLPLANALLFAAGAFYYGFRLYLT